MYVLKGDAAQVPAVEPLKFAMKWVIRECEMQHEEVINSLNAI